MLLHSRNQTGPVDGLDLRERNGNQVWILGSWLELLLQFIETGKSGIDANYVGWNRSPNSVFDPLSLRGALSIKVERLSGCWTQKSKFNDRVRRGGEFGSSSPWGRMRAWGRLEAGRRGAEPWVTVTPPDWRSSRSGEAREKEGTLACRVM